MAFTITTHNGNSSEVRREHNIRNPNYVKKEPHIDPNKPHEIWHDEKVNHAYRRIFGPSVNEYNARQTRPDRKIRNYHADVRKSGRKHDVYEMVVQIGGKDNAPEESLGYKILREYTDGWSRIMSLSHMDMPAAPVYSRALQRLLGNRVSSSVKKVPPRPSLLSAKMAS